jgi:hypothetical protein
MLPVSGTAPALPGRASQSCWQIASVDNMQRAGQARSHRPSAAPLQNRGAAMAGRGMPGHAMHLQHSSSTASHLQHHAVACSSVPVAHGAVSGCCRHPAANAACRIIMVAGTLNSIATGLFSCHGPSRCKRSSTSSATCNASGTACGVRAVHHCPYRPLVALQDPAAPAATQAVHLSCAMIQSLVPATAKP